ncbi:MAG TPA: efflux RND transporter periplasmic adaptor subunit [Chthoniobacterales bacterium]
MNYCRQMPCTACVWIMALALGISSCSKTPPPAIAAADINYWTCTMHPSVHAQKPGKCPICGMDLVPVMNKAGASASPLMGRPSQFTVPLERQQQFGVTYREARRRRIQLQVRSIGTFEPDRSKTFEYVAPSESYVMDLHVSSQGEKVKAGQALITVYSPGLRAAEQEFFSLLQAQVGGTTTRGTFEQLIESARHRLMSLNISKEEIDELERTRQPTDQLVVRSPFDGIVEQLQAKAGLTVMAGEKLVTVLDLSKIWLWAEFYENEIGLLNVGQRMQVTLPAFPGQSLEGIVSVINPVVEPNKRTVRVRVDLDNPEGKLLPGMYANVTAKIDGGEALAIPVDAAIPTGSRMLIFLDRGGGRLEPRFIHAGRQFTDSEGQGQQRYYEVLDGLNDGDRIVSSANFLIDAESQVQGAVKDWEPNPGMDSGSGDHIKTGILRR